MCVVTHSRYFSRLYLHEQSLETPTHVDSPALLKSVRLLVIWRFIPRKRVLRTCLSSKIYSFETVIHVFFYKKLVYKKLQTQETNLTSLFFFFKKLEKDFVCTLEVSHCFLLLSTQNICFYILIMKKILNFVIALLWMNERNWVLYYAVSQDFLEISKCRANS